ncbi:hypothetical protein ACJMK2_029666 [Sinanodonta woodiana]|uniref:TIR domain-containing protein n=1 Tax=Sinanodonta woodiana TaxID=1069815 RepID=A0ABD3XD78_SINWO
MATAGAEPLDCNLVDAVTFELKHDDLNNPWYTSVVVLSEDMVLVSDYSKRNLQLHRLNDAKLIAVSKTLKSRPHDICICVEEKNVFTVAVCLLNGQIEIMAVKYADNKAAITQVKTFAVKRGFDWCCAGKMLSVKDKIVVSGHKVDKMCWGIVSFADGHISTIQNICRYTGRGWSHLATSSDDTKLYISCEAAYPDTGLYGFDIKTCKQDFLYKPSDLKRPSGVSVDDKGFIYVCNFAPPCIHQLTKHGEPVRVHREEIPSDILAIFWDKQQGHLYTTSMFSRVVTRYTPQYIDKQEDHNYPEFQSGDEREQPSIQLENGIRKINSDEDDLHSGTSSSDLARHEQHHVSLRRRSLPPGKKYHVFFCYSSSDIHWVKKTIETLEKEHGFLCCEYDRDNTPGTSLLQFAGDSIRNAYKTVVVMTNEAFQSGFVLHEIEMAIIQGFNERRKCVVPLLLEDCEIPSHLSVLNFVDARDPMRRDIWWPRLLTELET